MEKYRKKQISLFAEAVYNLTKLIKPGQLASYAQIAKAMGKPLATRAVGQALHRNPFAPKVPCHRVIYNDGRIGGFAEGMAKKIKLLRKEGIIIKKDRTNLKQYQIKF